MNGDQWKCPQCRDECRRLAEQEEWQRREDAEIGASVSWVHYSGQNCRGVRRHGHVASLGRRKPRYDRETHGDGRAVWVVPDDGLSQRLLEKIWWDPSGHSYSREEWQHETPAPLTVYEHLRQAIDQCSAEADRLLDLLTHYLVNEPLPVPGDSELHCRAERLERQLLAVLDQVQCYEQRIDELGPDELRATNPAK